MDGWMIGEEDDNGRGEEEGGGKMNSDGMEREKGKNGVGRVESGGGGDE